MPPWEVLLGAAKEEVAATLASLPTELRASASQLPVVYERRPSRALVKDGLDPDLLGLFVGDPRAEDGQHSALPAQIILFLENLWEFSDGDEDIYREEVETTFLHELGHYLGLDEIDLEERGLD
ncbi:MAG: metallopeptidase family protein [Verrucomicrobiales bacterium]|nr:metallopeptidase family protein [Verrucomicrobiales bacterium]